MNHDYWLSFIISFFFFVLKLRFFFYLAPWTCPRSINSIIIRHDVANNEFILREEKEKKEKKERKDHGHVSVNVLLTHS